MIRDRVTSECELWPGPLDADGYGRAIFDGRREFAHRYFWQQANGPIPAGLCVLHLCDRPACVNVDHLVLGTPRSNVADRQLKGRQARGERNGRARLTALQVHEIRALRFRVARPQLAKLFGVSLGAIDSILANENWREPETAPAPEARSPERQCRKCRRQVRGVFSTHWQQCSGTARAAAGSTEASESPLPRR